MIHCNFFFIIILLCCVCSMSSAQDAPPATQPAAGLQAQILTPPAAGDAAD